MPSKLREHRRQPRAAHLGHHELEVREALEHAREQQLHERPLRVERHLGDEEQRGGRVLAVVGQAGAAVAVDRHAELFAHRPERVVDGS